MSQKVMIAGASGYIGTRVCKELFQKGYKVFALVRPETNKTSIEPWVMGYIDGDLQKRDCIEEIIETMKTEKISHIIASVGSVDYHQNYEVSRSINVETTKNIIEIALNIQSLGILKKLVLVGSVASRGFLANPPNSNNMIKESSDLLNDLFEKDLSKDDDNPIDKNKLKGIKLILLHIDEWVKPGILV
ncbi:NAD-dependent epimerase/dehydratase [Candidatus Magnetomorum sp. HK-1]|nr:NAD-dependent epimerase/dehydratase [Candidatus Magnetomorum sp. HK-1]